MNVIIGSARHDEKNKYSGGKKGDQIQTSIDDYRGEVSMQSFYLHSKGWRVLRPKYADTAIRLAQSMKTACNNTHIGYSQSDRYAILYVGTATDKNTNCDCSTLIRQCVKEATNKDPGDFTTANEAQKLLATGLFEEVPFNGKDSLYTGDVLVTKTKGHTVAVVSGKSRTAKHIQLNYVVNNTYTILTTALNVREVPINGPILYALKRGSKVKCEGIRQIGDAVWMYLGKDANGREKWCCADNGSKQYIG